MRLYHVDAFAERPFSGNPAAVCILNEIRDAAWMQAVAQEMNLSETAFVRRDGAAFDLRWFTPVAEVEMCGHATLASAHVLWELGLLSPDEEARFNTASGLLTATRTGDEIELDFPATPAVETDAPPGLAEALGLRPVYVGKSRFDYMIEVESDELVRGLRPDFQALRGLPVRGVMVTSADLSGSYDFVSRFFAPSVGVDEDPVTGSAHCCLAPFWSERLGKTRLVAHQVSRRGGVLRLRVAGDRVHLGGRAVTVVRGELVVARQARPAGVRRRRLQFVSDALVQQVVEGRKTASAMRVGEVDVSDGDYDDALVVGEFYDVFDSRLARRATIRVVAMELCRWDDIPERLWRGETNASADEFRQDHVDYFHDPGEGFEFVAYYFELVTNGPPE